MVKRSNSLIALCFIWAWFLAESPILQACWLDLPIHGSQWLENGTKYFSCSVWKMIFFRYLLVTERKLDSFFGKGKKTTLHFSYLSKTCYIRMSIYTKGKPERQPCCSPICNWFKTGFPFMQEPAKNTCIVVQGIIADPWWARDLKGEPVPTWDVLNLKQ